MTEIGQRIGLDIVLTLTEEKSAKEPYERPVFDKAIEMIKKGEADAILCYHVNRLARNMVEGGLLQHLLTKGLLKEIRTHNEMFSSGDNILPFVLQTAMSTQYSLDLSQHVIRGMTSKVESGWYPHRAPDGYVNNLFEHTIEVDPERFPLLTQAWKLMLTGSYSIQRLCDLMNTEWGYTTRKSRKTGGSKMSKSCLHRIFNNVFYTGCFMHNGVLFKGNHSAMVTFEEYAAVQIFLHRNGNTRAQSREFAYTGLVLCGSCQHQITAEHKTGRWKKGDYTYYHCANPKCRSKSIRQDRLEEEIEHYLSRVKLNPTFQPLCLEIIEHMHSTESAEEHANLEQQHRTLEDAQRRMSKLIKMSIKDMITEEDFKKEKLELQEEINGLKKASLKTEQHLDSVRQNCIGVANFVTTVLPQFAQGSPTTKKEIARKLGITYQLLDGNLETTLHPLLIPLYNRSIEPLKTGSESKKDGSVEPSVSLGCTEGTLIELWKEIWELAKTGAPNF